MSWELTYPYPVSPLKGASEDHFPFPWMGILLFCIFVCFPFSHGEFLVSQLRVGQLWLTSILICILWMVVVYYTVAWYGSGMYIFSKQTKFLAGFDVDIVRPFILGRGCKT